MAGASKSSTFVVTSPLEALLSTLEVSSEELLTEEVKAKEAIVKALEELAKAWVTFEEERRAYERNSAFTWGKSAIASGVEEVNTLLATLKTRIKEVVSLKIPRAALLTPAGSTLIFRKMDALTSLAAACPLTRNKISEMTRRLRIRNNQMRQRDGHRKPGDSILLNCIREPFFDGHGKRPEITWLTSL